MIIIKIKKYKFNFFVYIKITLFYLKIKNNFWNKKLYNFNNIIFKLKYKSKVYIKFYYLIFF